MNKQTEALNMAYKAEETGNLQDLVDAVNMLVEVVEALEQKEQADIQRMGIAGAVEQLYLQSLEQPAQEPVAWMSKKRGDVSKAKMYFNEGEEILPLYTHPAPSWQVLSDDEIRTLFARNMEHDSYGVMNNFARAIEQALKEKNHV